MASEPEISESLNLRLRLSSLMDYAQRRRMVATMPSGVV